MPWRREIEALIAPTVASPYAFAIDGAGVSCRAVRPGDAVFFGPPGGGGAPDASAQGGGAVRYGSDGLAIPTATARWVALSFLGSGSDPEIRGALLAEVGRVLAPGAALFVIDHNRPRRRGAAVAALARAPRVPGRTPLARWRRLAYPVAREVRAAGFAVDRLRLLAGERVQLVSAYRRPA